MKALSQRDPRWANEKLGTSAVTIGGYGCLITDIAMMANEAGDPVTPSELNERLIKNGGYASGNLVIFADVGKATDALTMTKLISCEEIPAPLDEIDARLAAGEMAAVEVWFEKTRKNRHWILLYAKEGNGYLIADPWDGQLKRLSDYGFGVWSAATIIRRAVFYKLNRVAGASAINTDGVRLRAAPGGKILGQLPVGTPVRILENGREWMRISVEGFVASRFVGVAPEPELTQAGWEGGARLLGIHELTSGKAREAIGRGAKAVMVFNDALEAYRLSVEKPDVIVMHRRWFTAPISSRDLIAQHGINPDEGGSDSRVWCRGVNENDIEGFDSSPQGILRRAKFDLECAAILRARAPDAVWVAGGFAHGNPDFTNDEVCRAVRDGYAAAYNAGLIAFDIHNYTKSVGGQPKVYRREDAPWYETRWRFLFAKCGFDPHVRRVVASEAGIEAGAGGFAWAGFTDEEFRAWCMYYLNLQRANYEVNGQSYPSPFVASALYQWGGYVNESWQGYELNRYMPVLEDIWKKEI